jgi:hypothetical protein
VELQTLADRFTRAGWSVTWNHTTVRATPPANGKKKVAAVEVSGLAEAKRLIGQIEKGTWTPEAKTRAGYDHTIVCPACGTKTSDVRYKTFEGTHQRVCTGCAQTIEAAEAQAFAVFAAGIEADIGAWLDAAPPLALLLIDPHQLNRQENSPHMTRSHRDAALYELAETARRWRTELARVGYHIDAASGAVVEVPATAVAPAAFATSHIELREILAEIVAYEEAWAAGRLDDDAVEILHGLGEQIDEIAEETTDEEHEYARAQLRQLAAQLDAQAVGQ